MTAESAANHESKLKYTRGGAILGLLIGGWGCLIGLGVQSALDTQPAPTTTPAQAVEQVVEYTGEPQTPSKEGLLYISVTVGCMALGAAAGRACDALSPKNDN